MKINSLSKENLEKIIAAAESVITALSGESDEINRDDSSKMVDAWDWLNDRIAPPAVVRDMARALLVTHEQEPVKRVNADQMQRVCLEANRHLDKYGAMAKEVNKLLLRHPAAAVPEKMTADYAWGKLSVSAEDCSAWADGWNARAAMQQDNQRETVRGQHAEWSQATFGNVGPVGPLKHLAKEALEAASEPGDLSEWADMQFLLWDAQRRAGITDVQINQAMTEKLAVNKARKWPEPKDGEPRQHIQE